MTGNIGSLSNILRFEDWLREAMKLTSQGGVIFTGTTFIHDPRWHTSDADGVWVTSSLDREESYCVFLHAQDPEAQMIELRKWQFFLPYRRPAAILGENGGIARARSLSPERRREIAINAAKSRWNKSE